MPLPFTTVLDWLRTGYPDGVPRKDFYPLLALLHRELGDAELEQIAERVIRESPAGDLSPAEVHDIIGRWKDAPVTEAELRTVSSHLAAAGWPLGDDPEGTPESLPVRDPRPEGSDVPVAPQDPAPPLEAPGRVQRVLTWLSAGYPAGIPATDRLPLLALLQRRLSDEEVEQVADRLIPRGTAPSPADRTDAGVAISHHTDSPPTEEELRRVSAELAARGWPLEARS